jgi:drug/metabolite transporter (DMT)-like permease
MQAMFGQLLFGESMTLMWWVGASLIFAGVTIVRLEAPEEDNPLDGEPRGKKTQ